MERVGRPALLSLFGCFHHGCQERNVPIWPTDTLAPEGLRPSAALLPSRWPGSSACAFGTSASSRRALTGICVSPALDEADPIDQSYCLEVSSPGVERELTRPEHFEAYRGRAVTVRLIRPRDGQRDFTGRLLEGADPVRLEMPEGEVLAFSQKEISSVRAVDEYEDDDDEPDLSGSITED